MILNSTFGDFLVVFSRFRWFLALCFAFLETLLFWALLFLPFWDHFFHFFSKGLKQIQENRMFN